MKLKLPHPIILAVLVFVIGVLVLNSPYAAKHATYRIKPPSQEPVDVSSRSWEPNWLSIPKLNIEAPIQFTEEKNEAAFQDALQHGVVHYPETALPGEYGNTYIFGHSSDLPWARGDYKTIFALLTEIENGDQIIVTDNEGTPHTYTVTGTLVVSPKNTDVLDQRGHNTKLLTLQTSYPLGTALRRFLVLAEILE